MDYKIKSNETISLCFVGDIHCGSSQFDSDFFEYWIQNMKRTKNKRIYVMGDCLEAASKHIANSSFRQEIDVNDQRQFIVEALEPFSDDIVIYHSGNHEARLSKEFDFDIAKDMARELGVTYSKGSYIDTFTVNGKEYNVNTAHGKGSASRRDLIIGKLLRDTAKIDATIFARGHLHHSLSFTDYYKSKNGLERKYYLCTGSFLQYSGGYAEEMQLNEVSPAYQILNINRNQKIQITEVDSIDIHNNTM